MKKKRYNTAIKIYERAIQCLNAMDDMESLPKDEDHVQRSDINDCKIKCFLNLGLCHLCLKDFGSSIDHLNKVLNIDKTNRKALFRRGICYREIGSFAEALADFKLFENLAQNNEHDLNLIKLEMKKLKEIKLKKQKDDIETFGGFLNKNNVRLYDDKKTDDNNNSDTSNMTKFLNVIKFIPNTVYNIVQSCCRKLKYKKA